MDNGTRQCEWCGTRARVRVLSGYAGDVPLLRHLCIACADASPAGGARRQGPVVFFAILLAGVAGLFAAGTIFVIFADIPRLWHKNVVFSYGHWLVVLAGVSFILSALTLRNVRSTVNTRG